MGALDGKAVVVTGSGGGLGRAYALELAELGARVVVNDVAETGAAETRDLIIEAGGTAVAHVGSVSDWVFADELIARSIAEFGSIDGLVNNAGIMHDRLSWEEDEASIRRTVEVNVLGSMFCGIAALREMVPRGSGSIVNITSGSLLGLNGVTTYGASKGAVAAMTYGWAVEVAGTGVRVNAVMPRAQTQMSAVRAGKATSLGASGVSVPKSPQPDVIAPAIAYLISDRAVGLNGEILRHDGQQVTFVHPLGWNDGVPVDGKVSFDEMTAAVDRLRQAR